MTKAIYVFLGLAILLGLGQLFITQNRPSNNIACTADAMMCADGSYVPRSGPNCEFVCPTSAIVQDEVQAQVEAKSDQIILESPLVGGVIYSPLKISGKARGNWFFEASFPVLLTNWDGLIIASGVAIADGDWMTEDFVDFTANLEFENPYHESKPDFMKMGALVLKKDNPSGLPEHDDALEIPVYFAP